MLASKDALWTPVQASKIIAYIDTYWHFNHRVRAAFIDKNFLMLKLDLGTLSVLPQHWLSREQQRTLGQGYNG